MVMHTARVAIGLHSGLEFGFAVGVIPPAAALVAIGVAGGAILTAPGRLWAWVRAWMLLGLESGFALWVTLPARVLLAVGVCS